MLCGTWALTRFSGRRTQQILPPAVARMNLLDATAEGYTFRDLAGCFLFFSSPPSSVEVEEEQGEGEEEKKTTPAKCGWIPLSLGRRAGSTTWRWCQCACCGSAFRKLTGRGGGVDNLAGDQQL